MVIVFNTFNNNFPEGISAKDIVLNLLAEFGANTLLGMSVELYGDGIDKLSLDDRITIASMGTEMGAIILLFTPNEEVLNYCEERHGKEIEVVSADANAKYDKTYEIDASKFVIRVSKPGKPHDTMPLTALEQIKIDSAFIGSCTNGRMSDMRETASILKGKRVAPGIVLKIVPATDKIWEQCLIEGLIDVFKQAGAIVSNAGCAGCAAGQVGQNGKGEVTVSTGNRNFPGKQGQGEVYLASPALVASSAIAGYITDPSNIPNEPLLFKGTKKLEPTQNKSKSNIHDERPVEVQGKVWLISEDNIDTDMIFHNRYLHITDIPEMGQYAFDNLKGYEDFAKKVGVGDIIVTGKNFGAGSSRQQAVDCFKSLGVSCIVAESFGAIYERNAINAAFPILTPENLNELKLENSDELKVNFKTGEIQNLTKNTRISGAMFSDVQMEIYNNNGLF